MDGNLDFICLLRAFFFLIFSLHFAFSSIVHLITSGEFDREWSVGNISNHHQLHFVCLNYFLLHCALHFAHNFSKLQLSGPYSFNHSLASTRFCLRWQPVWRAPWTTCYTIRLHLCTIGFAVIVPHFFWCCRVRVAHEFPSMNHRRLYLVHRP